MKKIVTLIVLLFFCQGLLAQHDTCSGTVVDAAGKFIANASVILSFSAGEVKKTAYTVTDSSGRFTFVLPADADSLELSISAIGYTAYTGIVHNNKLNNILITLKSAGKLLPTVSVRAAPKVTVKGDTTSFNADAYSRKNETNVEDLVKKLPGFDVDNDGNMRYNGKPIERVLLDGDDLYGRDFKLLTKNLAADAVETIQTIDNYNPNTLLSGLGKSGKQVLNLKLRKRKTTVNGNITIGGGLPENRYENRVNLLSVSKTLKLVALGGMNNTGVSPFSFINADRPAYLQRASDDETEAFTVAPLTSVTELNYRGIAPRRSNLNRSLIGTVNFLYHASPRFRLKGQAYLINDRASQLQQNNITYLTSQPLVQVTEQTQLLKKQAFQGYRLEATADLTKKSQLTYKLKFDEGNRKNDLDLALSGLSLQPWLKTVSTTQEHRLRYINRINTNIAFDAELIYNRSNVPQTFFLDSIPYPDALGLAPDPDASLYQRSDVPLRQTGLSVRLPGKIGIDNFQLSLTANLIDRDFDNTIFSQKPTGEVIPAKKDFGGYYSVSNKRLSAEGGYTKRFDNWDLSGTISWNYEGLAFDRQQPVNDLQDQAFSYPAYRISAGRKLSNISRVNIEYSYKNKLPQFTDLIPRAWLSTYRSTDRGSAFYQRLPERGVSFNYSLIDYYKKQVLLYAGFAYRNNPANYITSLTPLPLIETDARIASETENDGYLIYNRLEKYTGLLKGNLLFDLNTYWSGYRNILSGTDSRSKFNITTAKLGFKSSWKGLFNLTLTSTLKLNTQETKQADKLRKDKNRFMENQLNTFFVLPNQRFSVEVDINHYIIPNNKKQYQLFFLDFTTQYIVKKDKLIMSLTGNNIIGNRNLVFDNIGPISFTTQRFSLLPGFVLLKAYYKF